MAGIWYGNLDGEALKAHLAMLDNLLTKASAELNIARDDLVVRSLRPEDLGLSTPEWTFNISSSANWNTMVSATTISDNRYIGINGIYYAMSTAQAVSQIKITRGGTVARYWQIQGINFNQNPVAYFLDPFTAQKNTTLTIQGYGVSTGAAEKIIFIGLVVEKKGILVDP